MGRAARWFRSLLGGKKKVKENENSSEKEKKRWSFGKKGQDLAGGVGRIPVGGNVSGAETAWSQSYYSETEKEQNKHAIAVAAATAAAADAAVAAAKAAVAVVRLTSQGRGTMFGGGREWGAATKIQTVFRGYLARKALRALKGLVKLQAHVRGYLVRKQAAATLQSMEALIRAQVAVRSQKAPSFLKKDRRLQPDFWPRKSVERFDDIRSEYTTSIHSRRLSASLENAFSAFEDSPKIVEIDTCRPKSVSRRTNASMSDCGEDMSSQILSSSLPSQIPARFSIAESRNFPDFDWALTGDECKFSTAQSTPRFANSVGSNAGIMPITPAKSVCAEAFRQYTNFPNYMANTQSFRAKLRSHSAPKQRPEMGLKKRLSLGEIVEARSSLSGVRMQRSCSQIQEAFNFKNVVMEKLDRSAEFVRYGDRGSLERRW